MVTIIDSKISFVWGSCFGDHLWRDAEDAEPIPWLKPYYVMEYNDLRGGNGVAGFDFAWYPGERSAFWRFYLGGQALGEVRASDAWERMVPFRSRIDLPGVATDLDERIGIDAYSYELGVVVVLTVQPFKSAKAGLEEWVDRLRELRMGQCYRVNDGPRWRAVTVEEALAAVAKRVRATLYGGTGTSVASPGPICIANVLQADGGQPQAPVDSGLQRHLHAVTAWPNDWKGVALPPLDASPPFLPQRSNNRLPNDALYSVGRSLAIWRPGLFALPGPEAGKKKPHILSCFGHNLGAAAAQAEYLRLLAVAYAAQPKMRDRLDEGRVRLAGKLIDDLIRGAGTTYRSDSVRGILADKNSIEQVNRLLVLAGADPVK